MPSVRWREVWRDLAPHARRHQRHLWWGLLYSLIGVGAQLAIPWPIKALLHHWVESGQAAVEFSGFELGMMGAFALAMVSAGFFDHALRLQFARFAIGWSRDIRVAAYEAMTHLHSDARRRGSADIVTRLIADLSRFKAGVKVLLVYVVTNVILLGGATAIVAANSPTLGAVFAAATAGALAVAAIGSRGTVRAYLRHREYEGLIAGSIDASATEDGSAGFLDALRESGDAETDETRILGWATWITHGVVASAVLIALWLGSGAVLEGRMEPSTLLVFLAYVFLLSKPVVRLTRHGARTGKLAACGYRLHELLQTGHVPGAAEAPLDTLRNELIISRGGGAEVLRIEPEDRILVVGGEDADRRALVRLAAGRSTEESASVLWDGRDLARCSPLERDRRIGFLSRSPSWKKRALRKLLWPRGTTPEGAAIALELGVERLADDLVGGLDSQLSPGELAHGERLRIRLCRILADEDSALLVLDDPSGSVDHELSDELLAVALKHARRRALLVSTSVPIELSAFGRLIEVDGPRFVFDGPPDRWEQQGGPSRIWGELPA